MSYQSLETRIGRLLIKNAGLKEKDLDEVLRIQKETNKKIGEILIEKKILKPSDVSKALSLQLGLPFLEDTNPAEIEPKVVENLNIQFCRDNQLIPLLITPEFIRVGIADPFNYQAIDSLRLLHNKNVDLVVMLPQKIDELINKVFEKSENIVTGLEEDTDDIDALKDTVDLLEAGDDEGPIIKFVNSLLFRAVKEKASDIHIEPFEKETIVRFRIDGVLYDVYHVPKTRHSAIASRIKVMGELNIAEKRLPQDGRVKIKIAGRDIDIRISTVPVNFGERIVLRLLDKGSVVLDLPMLGFAERELKTIDQLLDRKYGIFLVTGPTGSGKSTTLSACLKTISSPELNIITVEDPVEYQIPGVGQIAVNPKVGLTFASGLRSILRQDPDVVMVGEIRDRETAEIAINASLTGHLVLSTIHTNDAPGAITRLVDMGVEPFLVSSSVVGVLAQRLIRTVCQTCAENFEPTNEQIDKASVSREELQHYFGDRPIIFKRAVGCSECRQTGYVGRKAIYELMVITEPIKNLILQKMDASSIRRYATQEGLRTLRSSAFEKLAEGLTTLEEVLRTTQLET
ncbi:MAG: type II secretion system ATPase GspE [Proteobacteria bacterium]|nr:type II secretion system ATPase GspE [Pseudomonadota bacterium]